MALQGLRLGPWLYDVAGLGRHEIASYLLTTALGYIGGSLFFGWVADRLAQRGVPRLTVLKTGLCTALAMLGLVAAGVQSSLRAILVL